MLGGMLLPVGVWLVLSSTVPPSQQRRLSAFALCNAAVTAGAFYAYGFALAFGAMGLVFPDPDWQQLNHGIALRLPPDSPNLWVIAGTRGFGLSEVTDPAVLRLFVGALPLPLTAAILLTGSWLQARWWAHVWAALVVSGTGVPLVLAWTWAGGWLDALGRFRVLGTGFADLGRLTTLGCLVGASAAVALLTAPRRPIGAPARLPEAHSPAGAFSGAMLALVGSAALSLMQDPQLGLSHLIHTLLVAGVAVAMATAYGLFVARSANALVAARALLAGLFAAASGAAWLPTWGVMLLGVLCGLAVTVGHFWVTEVWRLDDAFGLLAGVALPAMLGSLWVGLFGNSVRVTGLMMAPASAQAVGQWWLQLLGVVAAAGLGALLALPTSLVWGARPAAEEALPAKSPARPIAVEATDQALAERNPQLVSVSSVGQAPNGLEPGGVTSTAAPSQTSAPQRRSWLSLPARLRFGSAKAAKQPYTKRPPARHVAYPQRAGGRPLHIRPITNAGSSDQDATAAQ